MGVIYKTTCKTTGLSYIGQTRRSLEKRKKQHENAKDNYSIHKAIRKYGASNFIWEIIEECDNSLLNQREIYWIAFYNTYYNGYNETKGGDNSEALDNWRKNNSDKVIQNARKGLKFAQEYNKRYQKKHLEQLASVRQKGIDKVKKKVKCTELNLIFESAAEAERWSKSDSNPNGKKASHQHISHVCKGIRKTTGGYHWEYIE